MIHILHFQRTTCWTAADILCRQGQAKIIYSSPVRCKLQHCNGASDTSSPVVVVLQYTANRSGKLIVARIEVNLLQAHFRAYRVGRLTVAGIRLGSSYSSSGLPLAQEATLAEISCHNVHHGIYSSEQFLFEILA